MNDNNINDWEEVPVDDWQEVPVESPSSLVDQVKAEQTSGIQNRVQDVADAALNIGHGFSWGASDEASGLLGAITGKIQDYFDPTDRQLAEQGFQVDQPSFLDTYRQDQQRAEDFLNQSQERSPILSTAANIGGGILSGNAATGALKMASAGKDLGMFNTLVGQSTPIREIIKSQGSKAALLEAGKRASALGLMGATEGAVMGGLDSSEGDLIGASPEQQQALLQDIKSGATFGLAAGGGISGIQSAGSVAKMPIDSMVDAGSDWAQKQDYLRKLGVQYDFGKQGLDTSDRTVKNKLIRENLYSPVEDFTNKIMTSKGELGEAVGSSLDEAQKAGKMVNLSEPVEKGFEALGRAYDMNPSINKIAKAKQVYEKLVRSPVSEVTPVEAKLLLQDVDSLIGSLKSKNFPGSAESLVLDEMYGIRKDISESLKNQLDEYAKASGNFSQFMETVPENIMAGSKDISQLKNRFGDYDRAEQKDIISEQLKKLFGSSTEASNSAEKSQIALDRIVERMGNNKVPGFSGEDFQKASQKAGDVTDALRGRMSERADAGSQATMKSVGLGIAQGAKGVGLSAANIVGRVVRKVTPDIQNPAAKMSRNVFASSDGQLIKMADTMMTVPGLEHLSNALRQGIESGDAGKKNAALFSIMQNPKARAAFAESEQNEGME